MARVRTGRGFERLITFADAVVAIAMTLLVLPLVEIPRELDGGNVGDLLRDHRDELLSFLIGFLVIWALWSVHHRTMEFFAGYDATILRLTMVWLLTIVLLPFTTQLLNSDVYLHGAPAVYVGVLLVSALCLVALSRHGRRHRELLRTGPEVDSWADEPLSLVTFGILLVAFVLAVALPAVGTWPLLALLLDDRLEKLWLRWRTRHR